MINHGGKIIAGDYLGGKTSYCVVPCWEINFKLIMSFVSELGYKNVKNLYYRKPAHAFYDGKKIIANDSHVSIALFECKVIGMLEVYVENDVVEDEVQPSVGDGEVTQEDDIREFVHEVGGTVLEDVGYLSEEDSDYEIRPEELVDSDSCSDIEEDVCDFDEELINVRRENANLGLKKIRHLRRLKSKEKQGYKTTCARHLMV